MKNIIPVIIGALTALSVVYYSFATFKTEEQLEKDKQKKEIRQQKKDHRETEKMLEIRNKEMEQKQKEILKAAKQAKKEAQNTNFEPSVTTANRRNFKSTDSQNSRYHAPVAMTSIDNYSHDSGSSSSSCDS